MDVKKNFNLIIYLIIAFFSLTGCYGEIANKGKKAREYFANCQYKRVIETLETIKPSRRTANIDFLLGKSYIALFEFDKADQIFKNLFKRYPTFKDSLITAYLYTAERFEKRKRIDLAVKAYTSLLGIESEYNLGKGFYTMGHYYYSRNDLIKAKEFFERGIDNITDKRTLTKAKIELMDIYETIGMFKEAVEVSGSDINPDILYRKGKLSYKLAKDFFSLKELDSALVYCEKIIEINSPKILVDDTYFLMGEIYSEIGNYSNAVQCYREVVKLDRFQKSKIALLAKKKIEVLTLFNRGEW